MKPSDPDENFPNPNFSGGQQKLPAARQFVFVANPVTLSAASQVTLSPDAQVNLTPDAQVAIKGNVKLDPNSSVQIHGNPHTTTDFGGVAQPVLLSQAARNYIMLSWERNPGASAESVLVSFTAGTSGGKAITPVASSYKVSANKTFRITQISIALVATAVGALNSRIRLRQNGPQPVTNSSPIIWQGELGFNAAAAGDERSEFISPFDGLEVGSGQSITFTHIESVAAGLVSLALIGYEY